ncbi:MAG TPA: hypothetical protein VF844_18640 [Ktedonobacteraceae bacterium]
MPAWVNLKLNDPPGEIVPLPKGVPVTVCGAAVLLFQVTVVPAVTFSAWGLKAKAPLLCVMIVTTTVGAGVGVGFGGVGVGFGGIGVGLGLKTVGVGLGLDSVGVGVGRDDVGDGAEGVFVVPTIVVLATVGVVVTAVGLPSPPQAVNTINNDTIKRLYQALHLNTYMFFSILSASSRPTGRER